MITNSRLGEFYFYCKICTRDEFSSHSGASDLMRHCNSVTHQKMEKSKACTNLNRFFCLCKVLFHRYSYMKAEIKFTGFLTEHNLPIVVANHLSALVKECFPDSKIAQPYSCAKTKTFCVLNRVIYPDLQQSLI